MKEKFALWHLLFIQYLKRDWKKILIWVVGLSLFSGGFVSALEEVGKGQGLVGMYETLQNPAMKAMVGTTPIMEAKEYTVAAMYSNEMLLFCGLFAMILAALHVVGHTRKEEDLGLQELIRSFRVGQQANSLAVLVETTLINILAGVVTSGIIMSAGAEGFDWQGALLFGLSVSGAGILGSVIALLLAQIMSTAAGANGGSMIVIGLLYVLRGATDTADEKLSLFNPMGWTYLTYPFTENRWWPLLYIVIFSVIVTIIAFALEENRDMNGGYLPEWQGRAHAPASMLSVPGFFYHINRGVIWAWLVAYILLGAAYGSIYGDMQTFLDGNDLLKAMFANTGASIEASFTGTIMMVMMGLAAVIPIVVVNKLYAEETRMHLSQILSTKVSRGQLYWSAVGLGIVSGLLGVLLSAGGLGGAALSVMGKSDLSFSDFLLTGGNYVPVVLFFTGLAALALGFAPMLGKVVYGYLGFSFALSYFGKLLDLPQWFLKTSALNWPAEMPVKDFDPVPFFTVLAISLLLFVLGYYGYRQRDIREGA